MQGDPGQATGPRPDFAFQVSSHGSRDDESPGVRPRVNGTLDSAENSGHQLPFVEKDRLREPPQGSIGVSSEGDGIGFAVELYDGPSVPGRGRGLPGRSRSNDEERGQVGQQASDEIVDEPRLVRGHATTIPLSRTSEYRCPAWSATGFPIT
jgi:hypothetical protein